jgi:SAM-dependent methyltransferase
MSTATVQRAYNEVVAPHYDLDPQGVTGASLDRAVNQLRQHHVLDGAARLRVLDLGMGTGLFLAKLRAVVGTRLLPFGLDLSENMVAHAQRKLPDLVAAVADAADLDAQFPGQAFDGVCTHFITGFVPMTLLAPKIWDRLADGGYWSLVGGTLAAYPALQANAKSRVVRWLFGAGPEVVNGRFCNPPDCEAVVRILAANGFDVCAAETFEPALAFRHFDEFMEFAYQGGWLTPLIEETGLNRVGRLTRWLLNRCVFPIHDHHSIAIVLARKRSNSPPSRDRHGAGYACPAP